MKLNGNIKISVIIPVRNGSVTLGRCLESIQQQVIDGVLEIYVLDSSSTDNSVEIAKSFGAIVIPIEPGSFNHGLTRNMGVKLAKGDLIFFTVQDAFLSSPDVLAKMSRHFLQSEIMGVVGHQGVPHEKDKNPFLWFRRYTEPEVVTRHLPQVSTYEILSQQEKKALLAWDNVVAMYRKSALLDLPFAETDFAEDWIWSKSALERGWTLLYDPSVVVYHYHHQTFSYAFRLSFTVNYHFHKNFCFVPALSLHLFKNLSMMYHLLKQDQLPKREKTYWILHNLLANASDSLSVFTFRMLFLFGKTNGLLKGYNLLCKKVLQGQQKKGTHKNVLA